MVELKDMLNILIGVMPFITKNNMKLVAKLALGGTLVFCLIFNGGLAFAQQSSADSVLNNNGDLQLFVCDSLASIGLGCGPSQKIGTGNESGSNTQVNAGQQDTTQNEGDGQSQNYLSASISSAVVQRNVSDDQVILVKTLAGGEIRPTIGLNTNEAVFEIIKGQKHFIPTADIFFDYGFDLGSVQDITRKELDRFPRIKLVKVYGNGDGTHYITEGLLIRLIPNQKVFDSYGDREQDIITISKKEFNFYPRNQFVFVENPFAGDVFQVTDSGLKKYVVPQALKRMKITPDQIAPVNKDQLDAYDYGAPIIY